MNAIDDGCKGCSASVRLAPGEVERILAGYFQGRPYAVVDDATYQHRLDACRGCPSLQYGTTCKHCGCLVAVRARLADKACPGMVSMWQATTRP